MQNDTLTPASPETAPESASQPESTTPAEPAEAVARPETPVTGLTPQAGEEQAVEEKPSSEGEAGAATGPAAVPARRSWFYRFLYFTFSPETRLGRVMRPFLRWTAAVVGLFALGLLAGYLLLYQPVRQQLDAANSQLGQQNNEITRLQGEAVSLQNTLVTANQRLQSAQDGLQKAQARNNLLVVIYDVANARTYLAQKDGGKVLQAIQKAQADMQMVQPYMAANKKELADELTSRLATVNSTLARDPQLAASDLNNLYEALLAANDLLFGH